jgi:hypothetical protein
VTRAKISQYSATAGDNTDVNGVDIAEGCPPSSMNNMGREIMAALKRFQVGSDGDGVTVGGSLVVSGATTANTFSATNVTASGNLTFTGTGNRITGDMSNATLANRVAFESSITNGNTNLQFWPNGTAIQSGFALNNANSSTANRSNLLLLCNGLIDATIRSGITGSGTYLPITFYTGGSERMRIDTSGNVGIGTSSPTGRLAVAESTAGQAYEVNSSDGNRAGYIGTSNEATTSNKLVINASRGTGALVLQTVGTERMRIDSSGNVGIGMVSPSTVRASIKSVNSLSSDYVLDCQNSNSTSLLFLRSDNFFNSGAIANYSVAGTGLVIDGSNFVGKTTSSLRYKKDIVDYDKGLTAIESLRPVYYKSAVEGPNGVDPKQHAGFVAEEIADAGFEEFLVRDSEGRPDAVQYAHITALLVKSIQELKAELDTVKAELATLKGQA